LDVVFVVGLAEELVPGRLREDALLPERVRALAPGQLAPLRDRLDRQHRQLLAALAAAPERIVSFPRGDLRRSSTRLPSRWLLPSLRVLVRAARAAGHQVGVGEGRLAGRVAVLRGRADPRQRPGE
jgi:inactivated superfamily I helicase